MQPEVPVSLEELRAQRSRIAEHLSWLDSQIAHAEASGSEATPGGEALPQSPAASLATVAKGDKKHLTSEANTTPAKEELPPTRSASPEVNAASLKGDSATSPAAPVNKKGEAATEAEDSLLDGFFDETKVSRQAMDARMGCILMAVTVLLLFLFVVFGLSYYLY
jgi:hypothetical protein